MWCLEEHKGRYVYILLGYEISFGKSLSNIKIEGDTTISRLHAIVSLQPCEESELQYKCVICDKSKYGTYILRNGEKKKLPKDEKFTLKSGDKVQFGLKCSIFTVTYHSIMVVTSSLNKEEVDKLKDIIEVLGGTLCNNWNVSCTHLTVPNRFLFTTKLACALASANMIVTIAYWEAVMKAVKETKELPKIKNFLPTVNEEWLHAPAELLLPKEERRTLFRGLFFVHFCVKQYTSYNSIIMAAGGKSCVYPTKKPLTPRDLTAKNAIVIQQAANDSSQFTVQAITTDYPIIHNKLSALKRRMISDSEIPLAILYCSMEKFCNPKFNFGTLLRSSTQTFSSSDLVIVEDTQDMPSTSNKRKLESKEHEQIILETLDSQYDSDTSRRMRHCPENMKADIPLSNKAQHCPESRKRNIPENSNNKNDVCLFSSKDIKQPRIIPETCDSSDKSVLSDSFSRSSIKNSQIILESCDESSVDIFSAQDKCRVKNALQDIEIKQQEEVILEKSNKFILEKRNLICEKDDLLIEDNNATHKKCDLTLKKKNLMFEKDDPLDNLPNSNDEDKSESWKSSKRPRIVSIEKISNGTKNKICTDQTTEKVLKKGCSRIEEIPDCQVKQQNKRNKKVEVIDVSKEDNRKEEKSRKIEEMRIKKRYENRGEEKRRKKGTDWYENYLDSEFTDMILRKDAPRGKKFVKVLIPAPTRKLGSDDFVL